MTSMNFARSTLAAALAVLAFAATPVAAQENAPAAQQQAPRKPQGPSIMKTFGGWDVRCYPVSSPAPCDVWEAIAFKKSNQLAASVSVVYVPSRDEYLMQFIVPLGVDLPKGVKLIAGNFTSPVLPFHHCDRIGCFVGVAGGNDIVNALKGQDTMKVHIEFFRGKAVDIGVPLKGFLEARNEMVELAKQKAASATPSAPPTSTTP
jgi:invasion protein IalB